MKRSAPAAASTPQHAKNKNIGQTKQTNDESIIMIITNAIIMVAITLTNRARVYYWQSTPRRNSKQQHMHNLLQIERILSIKRRTITIRAM